MQNKLTDKIEIEEIDIDQLLSELTSQQYIFTLALIDPNLTDHEAYHKAYPNNSMSKSSISVEVWKLKHHPKINKILTAARMQGLGQALDSREEHLQRLRELSRQAQEAGNYGAAVNAEVNAGKVSGHYIERHENINETRKQELEERMALLTNEKEDRDSLH